MPKSKIKLLSNEKIALIAILIFSFLIRVVRIEEIPPGFYPDELFVGFDAYSLIHTYRDSHGNFLPWYFRDWDSYIDPIYPYSVVPFVALFGNNVFAVRFASVLYGTLSVLTTYLLVKEMFNKKLALLASFFLSISPWHFVLNRIAFHVNSFTFYFTLGLYFLFKGLKRNSKFLWLGSLIIGASLYTYFVSRLFVPLFLLGFFFIYRDELLTFKKDLMISIFILVLVATPLIYNLIFNFSITQKRFNDVSIFRGENLESIKDELKLPKDVPNFYLVILSFLRNYFSHLSPNFLFISGDSNLRHSLKGFGQLYIFQAILIFPALLICLKEKKKEQLLLLLWFFLFPMPASFTYVGIPHAIRAITGLPLFEILSSIGTMFLVSKYQKSHYKKFWTFIFIIFLIFSVYQVVKFFYHYFFIYPNYSYWDWHTNFGHVIQYIETIKNNYEKVMITSKCCIFPQYYIAFFSNFDVREFHAGNFSVKGVGEIGKYVYGVNIAENCYENKGYLYVIRGYDPYRKEMDNVRLKRVEKIFFNPDETIEFIVGSGCSRS
jgi:4-amino-4-deoxy-L-arabinose transferase-like glycosyltransferase